MKTNKSRLDNIARRRIQNILRQRKFATMRMLEQKICDAGPLDQRMDPHILTRARKTLEKNGFVIKVKCDTGNWYRLASTPEEVWKNRLELLEPILRRMQNKSKSVGQVFEIAVYRALRKAKKQDFYFFGGFPDLDISESKGLQKKVEPPSMISERHLTGERKLDFLLMHPTAGPVGVEVKNTREWIYPQSDLIREFLSKCCEQDAVPVMICRRYAYVTYSVLNRCGVLLYQNYNQLMPESLHALAEKARHKDLLGYHDIQVGDQPSSRLCNFIVDKLPELIPEARNRFSQYQDLVAAFASGSMQYDEFVARSKRREKGIDEDWGDRNPYV